ncbi:MAG TPA: hypothetical protein ENI63_00270 [Candidatus Kaiserbacteria bacterium]|nr:hypothetical protein [Candidatus Kaiserbacteria bacterium]
MNRKSIDDIISPEDSGRRSIRKVSVDRSLRRKKSERVRDINKGKDTNFSPKPPRTRRASSGWGLWIIALISFLVLIFGFSFLFSGARLIITPKQRTVLVDANFNASKTPKANEFRYEMMTTDKEGSKNVTASGEEFVKEKASGEITIYNNFNSSNQRLIKNTRFETPEGLIYRIDKSIIVPGQKKKGGTLVPGSIEVTVYADENGEKYNIGLTDFTIPGFKRGPRFNGFYARSKTEMIGGFVGKRKVISKEDETKTRDEIKNELSTQLLKDAYSQKPEGFEMYKDGIFVTFTSLPNKEDGGSVSVREKALLYGVLFEQKSFAKFLAKNTIAGFDGEDVEISNPDTLKFNIIDKENVKPWVTNGFSFKLGGKAHIVWSFDTDSLKRDLVGKSKGALQTVLTGYPSIDEAKIVLRPFWRQTFPDKVEDIKINTIIDK